MGLVNENFNTESLEGLKGNIGVGHVRYSTAGQSTIENAQPLVLNYIKGTLALAHNGNLVNAPELKRELARTGAIFQTTIDSEIIAYHVARARVDTTSVEEAVSRAMDKLKGAYSLVIMSPRKLIGARDPFGFRPLCIGKRGKAYILASETCALDAIGAEYVRDVEPGEIVTISPRFGIHSDRSHCIRSSRPQDACLSIFILEDLILRLTTSASIIQESLPASISRWTVRWMRIWSSVCQSPETLPHWDSAWRPEFRMDRDSTRTATLAVHSSSPGSMPGSRRFRSS